MQLASNFNRAASVRVIDSPRAPITVDAMRARIPSVFAESAHESRSKRYTYLPTVEILNGLGQAGFQPFYAIEARTRDANKIGYTKHMLRLRHVDHVARAKHDVNEIILLNSHDGSSAYQMIAGCFRFVCCNGMVVGDSYGEIRVRHSGNVQTEIVQGALGMLERFEVIDASKDRMQSLQLTSGEQRAYARAALAARYPDPETPAPIEPDQLLQARRWEDRGDSLWHTFNRVQENMVHGGLRGRTSNNRRTSTRAINGIDQNVGINRALWTLADEMAKLKG